MKLPMFYPVLLSCVIVFASCDSKRIARLEHANDSLKEEIRKRDHIIAAIENAHRILDSLDIPAGNDKGSQGVPDRVYDRLRAVVHFVRNSENELSSMQKRLRNSEDQTIAYLLMADALQSEVGIRDGEIKGLADSVSKFQSDYAGVFQNLQDREREMQSVIQKIEFQKKEVSDLNRQIEYYLRNAEGEAYFMRARQLEDHADKIRFAPSRKRDAYREALELYRKSFSLGRYEAQPRIILLEKYFKGNSVTVAELNSYEASYLK